MPKSLVKKLGSMNMRQLQEIAKTVGVRGFTDLKKADLIETLATNPNVSLLINPSWWEKHHNHVYGCAGVIGVILTLVFFVWPNPATQVTTGSVKPRGNPSVVSPNPKAPELDYALQLTGENSFVSISNHDGRLDLTRQFTIEAWFKPLSIDRRATQGLIQATDDRLTGKDNQKLDDGWFLMLIGDNSWGFCVHNEEKGSRGAFVPGTLELNTWVHIACTYDGKYIRVYQNGKEVADLNHVGKRVSRFSHIFIGEWAAGATHKERTDTDKKIGFENSVTGFQGLVDEIRLWNIARTGPEIRGTLEFPLDGSETGLIGYWPLNDGSGYTAADRTSGGSDGRLSGGTDAATNVAAPKWQLSDRMMKIAE